MKTKNSLVRLLSIVSLLIGLQPAHGAGTVVCDFSDEALLPENAQVRSSYGLCEEQRKQELAQVKTKKTFEEITGQSYFQLRGDYGSTSINFGNRGDHIVQEASITLNYSFSPSLLPIQSHVKVYLNNTVIDVIHVDPVQANLQHNKVIKLDPLAIADFNNIRFELIGHYSPQCEDPQHSSLWFDINKNSTLTIASKTLNYQNDLVSFPEPFYDERDFERLTLPFVFAENTAEDHDQQGSLFHSAGVLASWFGAMADWRGAHFPAYFNQLPDRHSVVFATNAHRPKFLREFPDVQKPTIEMVSHPLYRGVKILLILGKDQQQLAEAVQGLVLGIQILTGNAVEIQQTKRPGKRKPYDAPRWVRTDRPMKFIELVDSHSALQVSGHQPESIRVNMRVPADLFTWRNRGIPVDLKYRYTPPLSADNSRLNVNINQQFVQSFNLQISGRDGIKERVRIPLLGDGLFGMGNEFFLPAFRVGAKNQMQFDFSFAQNREGVCQTSPLNNVRAAIDPDSEIDFSDFPHYAVMPNLGFFANAGFPFTKYADLSQTAIVVDSFTDTAILSTLFDNLALFGASTGYPALSYSLDSSDSLDAAEHDYAEKDILYIGSQPNKVRFDNVELLPNAIKNTRRHILQPVVSSRALADEAGYDAEPPAGVDARVDMESTGNIASIIGFESPFASKRSVVAMMGNNSESLGTIADALRQSDKINEIYGSVVILRGDSIQSNRVGASYYVGELPAYTWLWYHLSGNPLLLAFFSIIAVVIVSLVLWRLLRDFANKRLE